MKRKLLYLSIFLTFYLGQAQSAINNYFSTAGSVYAIVNGTVDHLPSGSNVTWNFSGLTQVDTNMDSYAAPTAAESSSYLGTTEVLTITETGSGNTNKIFYKLDVLGLGLTAIINQDVNIDYNGDALLGFYPFNFNDVYTENTAGYLNTPFGQWGFTGTITTEVDAHGTLTINDVGQGGFSGSVTRIKTIQNMSAPIPFVGVLNVMITNYNYYNNPTGDLIFRATETEVTGPVNESTSTLESLMSSPTLGVDKNKISANNIKLYPNPVDNRLNIEIDTALLIKSLQLFDVNGRLVLSSTVRKTLDVSGLKTGFYLIKIETNKGLVTKKFVKN